MSEVFSVASSTIPPIREWPAGHFWTCPSAIGTTLDELAAFSRNEVSEARAVEMKTATQLAFVRLRDMPCSGWSWWMQGLRRGQN